MKKMVRYFSIFELSLWFFSVLIMILCFILFEQKEYLYLIGSIIGSTALIFLSKGHPLGQLLTIVFAVFYGVISYSFSYYGEMITYLLMTAPIALLSLITWLKNPYKGKKSEVKIHRIKQNEYYFLLFLGTIVTVAFYFILKSMSTNFLIISTISVFTSFIASYLTMRRSIYYALAYALNDVVLIVLWVLASFKDSSYIAIVICFVSFLVHDLYGFLSWKKRYLVQSQTA